MKMEIEITAFWLKELYNKFWNKITQSLTHTIHNSSFFFAFPMLLHFHFIILFYQLFSITSICTFFRFQPCMALSNFAILHSWTSSSFRFPTTNVAYFSRQVDFLPLQYKTDVTYPNTLFFLYDDYLINKEHF